MEGRTGRREDRFVGPRAWVSYRGGWGMLLWAVHRVAGLGILLFLSLHIVDIQVTRAIGEVKQALAEGGS